GASSPPPGQGRRNKPYDSVVTTRDELGDSTPESSRPPAAPPSAMAPSSAPSPGSSGWSPGPSRDARARGPRRGVRLLLMAGLAAGLAGLVVSAGAAALPLLPRHFSAAPRDQIMAWGGGKRGRTWPGGPVFPSVTAYKPPRPAVGRGPAPPPP